MAESRLVIGPKISDASSANSLFTTRHFALPEFHHHYLFHVEFTVTDQHFNAPGVFPRHNIRLTTDMFPLTRTWYQVSVGPLLAKSTAELVFLSLVEGNIQTGIASRIGLIRVSTLSAPEALDGEQLGSPLLGEIEVGDLSKWKRWHQPILERHVCSSFPESHRSPVATMYDFRVLNYVACVPALIAHLLQHTPSRSDSGYSQSDHHTPSASRDNIDDEKIEEHRTSNFTPLSIDDNPLMRYLSSAYAAESSETSGTYLNAGDSRHPVPRFNHGITPRSPSPQKPGASLSGIAPAYHRIPHQHYGGTSYTSIASVLDRQYNYSQNGGVDHSLLFYSVSDSRNAHLVDPYSVT